ncbi:MAG: orotidine 5'-phosphate decarboxylase [Candidatus Heimdallarchaeota archaeon]|nr:orotidine 5'-phosphate decarboxylase [Candidatus Heimdallarchaeota archaeon]MCK5144105.1 orotidine 5'-phosphate decarboxylase [Candidatus Heimdallarchaeota archaeon]
MKISNPPYLQIALDLVDKTKLVRILSKIPDSDKILLEAGTPLIKKFGIDIVKFIREFHPSSYTIADMKTLDVGWLEVQIAAEASANAVAISGLAPNETLVSSIEEAEKRRVDILLDCMNVESPSTILENLTKKPEIVLFHRGIDQEGNTDHPWNKIKLIKAKFPESKMAVAGGLNLETSARALNNGADIIIIGRAITQADNIKATINDFLHLL